MRCVQVLLNVSERRLRRHMRMCVQVLRDERRQRLRRHRRCVQVLRQNMSGRQLRARVWRSGKCWHHWVQVCM